ncbi:MAG: GNAT family N-acetyltransferase [Spirochaetes bacterium GWF1_31_7]|nr:MAG: GNAT family N-acetyltransferase [Spirochaetes bacterium GWE1_32_154]OHD47228.1 MAG: GNAT family N-acetyltransferase [Spirochaetes bacterium GWF1_31_7]OHD52629.1 MAG: GNAT family N-acetyltransferase [Spirochaetes bacterium GWE2_31_10]HBD94294.1 GNAT family N-acetyltransferase [Spirochaetia bacterium]HBI36179.1 GNAT family N-acetyltransferase [Spirochaetia bacterium]
MKIELKKATIEDAILIYEMQIKAFAKLLGKYQDYEISPGAEKLERIIEKLNQSFTNYYLIKFEEQNVGAVRIITMENENKCRISPIFILDEYQNKGIAQKVFELIENKYKNINNWILDTILEEIGNCYLYEKLGYIKTGKIEEINENMHIVYYEKKYK